jgi:hypothetical protein
MRTAAAPQLCTTSREAPLTGRVDAEGFKKRRTRLRDSSPVKSGALRSTGTLWSVYDVDWSVHQ